jgi:hypothetical protein
MENWTDKEIGNINSLIQTASSENIKISMEILQNSTGLVYIVIYKIDSL